MRQYSCRSKIKPAESDYEGKNVSLDFYCFITNANTHTFENDIR